MTPPAIRVLLVEDNPWDAHLVSAMLTRADVHRPNRETYALATADRLSAAIDRLRESAADEFMVLAIGTGSEDGEALIARLNERLESCETRGIFPVALPMSVGTVRIEPDDDGTMEEHVRRADALMYERKRDRHVMHRALAAH